MMYIENVAEIEEWILDGRPARLKDSPAGEKALLQMPAYRGRISENEVEELVAYYQSTNWYEPEIPDDARAGRKIASRSGCFGCHGVSGQAGVNNPGSLKGYIPGWTSSDFFELVKNEDELRAWILNGGSERFLSNPMAQYFTKRQAVQMPSYKGLLSADETESLVLYIQWLARNQKHTDLTKENHL